MTRWVFSQGISATSRSENGVWWWCLRWGRGFGWLSSKPRSVNFDIPSAICLGEFSYFLQEVFFPVKMDDVQCMKIKTERIKLRNLPRICRHLPIWRELLPHRSNEKSGQDLDENALLNNPSILSVEKLPRKCCSPCVALGWTKTL